MDLGTMDSLIGMLSSLREPVFQEMTSRRLTREQRRLDEVKVRYWELGICQWQDPCNNSPVVLAEWRQQLISLTQAIQGYESGMELDLGSDLPLIFDDSGLAEAKLELCRLQKKIQRFILDLVKAKREGNYRDYSSFTLDPTKEDLGVPYNELPYFLRLWLDLKRSGTG